MKLYVGFEGREPSKNRKVIVAIDYTLAVNLELST